MVIILNTNDEGLNKGRIVFRHKNVRFLNKELLFIGLNIVLSIIFGVVGSFIFIKSYEKNSFKNVSISNQKYDEDILNVINKIGESIVGVSAYIKDDLKGSIFKNSMTGVLYSEDGYIVTNYSGLENASKIYIKFPSAVDVVKEGKIVSYNEKYDISLIKIQGDGYMKGNFKNNMCDVTHGLKVISIGNHLGDFNSYSVYSGLINGFGEVGDLKFIKSDVKINNSNTGGPVCDVNGEILGLISNKFNDLNNLNGETSILISSQDIIKLINEMIKGAT